MGIINNTETYPDYEIDLMDRRWKLLTSSTYGIRDNKYLISEYGDIYNLQYKIIMRFELSKNRKGELSYKRVNLQKENDTRSTVHLLVHRLVALYFLEANSDPENKIFVDHLDGDKSNNHYSNLEWVTPEENAKRAYDKGLSHTKGEMCHLCRYTDDQIHLMCQFLEKGYTSTEVLIKTGMIDFTGYALYSDHPDYKRLRSFVKKLRSKTFRKDIVNQYNF